MRCTLDGTITGIGFSSGHRIVIGHWQRSPIGPFADLMWADPSDRRTLIASTDRAATFITAIYAFDDTVLDPALVVETSRSGQHIRWTHGEIDLTFGRSVRFPPRPDWITERIERPIARRLLGVETFGVSPSGVEELYRSRRLQRVTAGKGELDGADLGALGAPRPACGFGFSEPPPFASITKVSPRLHDPSGTLDRIIEDLQGERSR